MPYKWKCQYNNVALYGTYLGFNKFALSGLCRAWLKSILLQIGLALLLRVLLITALVQCYLSKIDLISLQLLLDQ